MKKTNNLKDPKDEQPENDCENIPPQKNELLAYKQACHLSRI